MKKKFKRVGALALAAAMAATLVQGDAGKADAPGNYSYFNDYTLGWNGGITDGFFLSGSSSTNPSSYSFRSKCCT